MAKRLTKAQRAMMEREDSAWAMLGVSFVKLLRDRGADDAMRSEAWNLSDWLYVNLLSDDERRDFMTNTGVVMESEFAPDPNYKEPYDYPRPEPDEDIPF